MKKRRWQKPEHDTLHLCARAGEMLKAVGFVHHYTSMRSEAVYYRWPGKTHLLRVSAHPAKFEGKFAQSPLGAKLTLNGTHITGPGKMRITDEGFEAKVAGAIGRYFLKSAPDSKGD